jgi:hypothetical protein
MGPPRGNQPGVRIRSFAGGQQGWGMPVMARKKGERRVRGLVPGRERGEWPGRKGSGACGGCRGIRRVEDPEIRRRRFGLGKRGECVPSDREMREVE